VFGVRSYLEKPAAEPRLESMSEKIHPAITLASAPPPVHVVSEELEGANRRHAHKGSGVNLIHGSAST
jgi:hypothetical protein